MDPRRGNGNDAMTRRPVRPAVRVTTAFVVIVATAAYAWWVTGLRPFTTASYVAVGLPGAALVLVMIVIRLEGSNRDKLSRGIEHFEIGLRTTFPWLILFAVTAGIEIWALVLGGRSTTVPTLSTVVDHAMAWHVVRFVLFCGWLAAGLGAMLLTVLRSRNGDD
jgi:hypothetical protein